MEGMFVCTPTRDTYTNDRDICFSFQFVCLCANFNLVHNCSSRYKVQYANLGCIFLRSGTFGWLQCWQPCDLVPVFPGDPIRGVMFYKRMVFQFICCCFFLLRALQFRQTKITHTHAWTNAPHMYWVGRLACTLFWIHCEAMNWCCESISSFVCVPVRACVRVRSRRYIRVFFVHMCVYVCANKWHELQSVCTCWPWLHLSNTIDFAGRDPWSLYPNANCSLSLAIPTLFSVKNIHKWLKLETYILWLQWKLNR